MGKLTTHILDTTNGRPADNVCIRLFSSGAKRELLMTTTSNNDGRTSAALLDGAAMESGTYELEFDIGAYFSAQGNTVSEPPFLDTVIIRFSMRAEEHYHVPLLVSPWSYSTYRGS